MSFKVDQLRIHSNSSGDMLTTVLLAEDGQAIGVKAVHPEYHSISISM